MRLYLNNGKNVLSMYLKHLSNVQSNSKLKKKERGHPLSVIDAKILWDPPANNITIDLSFHIGSKS